MPSKVSTVVWLLWVVGRLVGSDGLAALLAFLVAVAFAAWVFGRLQAAERTLPARGVALTATVAGSLLLLALPFEASTPAAARATEQDVNGSTPWEPAVIQSTLAAGQPAFVYFTADWCITCKVNERGTLASESVRTTFEELEVRVFKGDWTQRDAAIVTFARSRSARRHGRSVAQKRPVPFTTPGDRMNASISTASSFGKRCRLPNAVGRNRDPTEAAHRRRSCRPTRPCASPPARRPR